MRRVALIYDARLAYDVKVMSGVAAYLQEHAHHSVFIEENALKDQRLPDLRSWEGDGIIADFDDPSIARIVIQSRLPAVGFGGGYGWHPPSAQIPYFYTNNRQIAALAADHLLERGFKSLAYCGYPRTSINGWSAEREQAFIDRVQQRGLTVAVFHGRHRRSHQWAAMQRALSAWLQALPKPVGIMTANDNRGRHVLEACRTCDLRVPDQVAVIGVDNDELLCQLSSPPLSSVEQGAKGLGYAAAALLDRMMDGQRVSKRHFVIDPLGVVTRRSIDVVAIDDPDVAGAMAYIREHAFRSIRVPDVVRAGSVSRSTLETRFRAVLHCTVHAAIRRVQLERARRRISETELPLKQIAADSGFKSVQHLTTAFSEAFGQTPARYRRSTRGSVGKSINDHVDPVKEGC